MSDSDTKEKTVINRKLGGGPHGIGDPDDQSLRKVEVDVMVAKKMRDIARTEKCTQEVGDFTECCSATGLLMVVKCRKENSKLKECLTKWYTDDAFKEHCKKLYLEERTEYRRTGIPLKQRLQGARIGSNM